MPCQIDICGLVLQVAASSLSLLQSDSGARRREFPLRIWVVGRPLIRLARQARRGVAERAPGHVFAVQISKERTDPRTVVMRTAYGPSARITCYGIVTSEKRNAWRGGSGH